MRDTTPIQKVITLLEETVETLSLPGNHSDTVWLDQCTTMVDQLEHILEVARNGAAPTDNQTTIPLPGEPWAISRILDREVLAMSPDWKIWKGFAELVPLSEIPGSVRKVISRDGAIQIVPTAVRVQVGWFLLMLDQQSFLFQVPLSSAFAEEYASNMALLGWYGDAPLLCKKQLVGSVESYDEMCSYMERTNKTLGVSVSLLPEITGIYNDLVPSHVLG